MNHEEFAREYEGVQVLFPGVPGVQCVGLARYFWQKVHGIPRNEQPATTPSGGAKDLLRNVGSATPRLRVRGKDEQPQLGDMVVWGATRGNKWGHVAILMEVSDKDIIEVFEQDGFRQDLGAKWKVWTTENVTGYICIR